MKTILVLFVLLVPSVAWAEEIFYSTDRNRFEYADGRVVPHNMLEAGKDYPQLRAGEMQCTDKMQAAMEAMDEFTPKREEPRLPEAKSFFNTLRYIWPCVSDDCLKADRLAEAEKNFAEAQAELDRVKRREDAITQWASVKRDCWRATGSPGTP